MKKTIILLLIALGVKAQQQVNLQIVRVTSTVCAGDSIRINYKAQWPSLTTNQFTPSIFIGSTPLVIKSWQYLKSQPKEHFAPLIQFDSAHWIMANIPNNITAGVYTIASTGVQTKTVYVANCSCTVTANFIYSDNYGIVTYSSTSIGTNSNTTYQWDLGFGTGYQSYPATFTTQYIYSGTYTVGLVVTNPTCTDTKVMSVAVNTTQPSTVGISEHELNNVNPFYYDLSGNRIEKTYNTLIIERVGLKSRKVVVSE